MSRESATAEKSEELSAIEHEPDIETMRDPEFWQRIALEAVVNDDPAKALSLRVEAFFSGAECYPCQPDTLRVIDVDHRELFEWLITPSVAFEFETIEEDERGLFVRGIEYSQFEDRFSSESESADEDFGIDSGQDIDLTQIEAVEDKDGNRWQVSRSYSREPTLLGGQYRSRIILSYDGDSKKLRPQTFVDQITDGTYSVRDCR